jgi:predicted acylesterase/phospholipase RssA
MSSSTRHPITLGLQGGGTHGAFTWGVLDRLLEDERLAIEGVSGASAGAIKAALLVQGYEADGANGARAAMDRFWHLVADMAWMNPIQPTWLERLQGNWNLDANQEVATGVELTHGAQGCHRFLGCDEMDMEAVSRRGPHPRNGTRRRGKPPEEGFDIDRAALIGMGVAES